MKWPCVRTDISVGGITESVSVGLGDLFSLDRIFSGALQVEARQPQYGFFADLATYMCAKGEAYRGFRYRLPWLVWPPS